MKNVILFVAILTVCGSLKMADRKPCPDKTIERRYYLRGKLVGKMENNSFISHQSSKLGGKTTPQRVYSEGKPITIDSTIYEIK